MKRLDVSLNLFDPLNDLLFEDLLPPLHIVLCSASTSMPALQIDCCTLDVRLGEHLDLVCISGRPGCSQLVELQSVLGH